MRKLIDCLIAAVAIREQARVLHNDRDFEVLGRHTRLRPEPFVSDSSAEPPADGP